MRPTTPRRPISKSDINKLVAVLRQNGIQPTGAEILPDGTVRVLSGEGGKEAGRDGSAFDAWWRENGEKI
jgi:hypothetical protein